MRDRYLIAAVGLVAFAAYWLTLSRGVLGGDAGELQFVPPILGLTHPTGYPLQVLVHYAWSFVPIGSVAYRLNLLDAIFAAGAVAMLVGLCRQAGLGPAASAMAGLSLAFGELWWSQAVRGDKYTLNGLFLVLVLLLLLRWRVHPTPGRLAVLSLAFGLSLAHHRSMVLAAPALGVGLVAWGWRPWALHGRRGRGLLLPVVLVLAPLLLYAYVPWAGARGLPPGSWPVDTPSAFVEFLLDRGYASQIRPDAAFGGRLTEEATVLLRSFGPLGALLGLFGVGVSFVRDRRLGLVLLLVFVPNAVLGASYLLESHYDLPRHWVFYLPGILIWAVWLGFGLDTVVGWLATRAASVARRRSLAVGGLLAVVLLVQAGSAWARSALTMVRAEAGAETLDDWRQDLQKSPPAERFGRLAFALAARNAVIVCDWEEATVLWYFQRVESQRPDLTIRYPIERLDETLAEARSTGQTVYISRTLPGVESNGVTSSVGPLLQVSPPPTTGTPTRSGLARFEGGLTLADVDLGNAAPHPGDVLPFTLHWQAEAPLSEAYAVSVRLLSPSGVVLAAHDVRHPALGTSPTNAWAPDQLVGDYHELPLGSRLAPGDYQIQILPYRVDPLSNLHRLDVVGRPGEEGVTVPIEVGPRQIRRPLDLVSALLAR
jgi:hypothetical protein